LKKKLKFFGNVLILIILFVIAGYVLKGNWNNIAKAMFHIPFYLFLVALALGLLNQYYEGKNISFLVSIFGSKMTVKDGFLLAGTVGFSRTISFGTLTFPSEVLFYKKHGLETYMGIGITIFRLMLYKFTLLVFSILSLLFYFWFMPHKFDGMLVSIFVGIGVTLIMLSVLSMVTFSVTMQAYMNALLNRVIKKESIREKIDEWNIHIFSLRFVLRELMHSRDDLLTILSFNFIKVILWFSIPFVTLIGHNTDGYVQTFALASFATILGGVIPAPGGIGGFEFVYTLLFTKFFGVSVTVSSLIIYRMCTYFLPFFIGMLYQATMQQRNIRNEYQLMKGQRENKK
jgi:uncharacterized membrane protein YbhN (UPF0104 family)